MIELAIRKVETIRSLEELGLKEELTTVLQNNGITAEELIWATRNDIAWRSYLPDETWTNPEANHLMVIPGVGEAHYVEVMAAVIRAGFIITESELSREIRQFSAKRAGTPQEFLENYEELEDLFPL